MTELNPLDILEERKLDFLPLHMTPVPVVSSLLVYNKQIKQWVDLNLKGRYFIGSVLRLDNNVLKSQDVIAFEDPKESTMFLLACPYLAKSGV